MRTSVVLIDSDLGFVFWLGRALDSAGYEAFPARSIPDAVNLIDELHLSVGLVIIDHTLPGAARFIEELRNTQKSVKVIGLVEEEEEPPGPEFDGHSCRPDGVDRNSEIELLQLIRRLFLPQIVVPRSRSQPPGILGQPFRPTSTLYLDKSGTARRRKAHSPYRRNDSFPKSAF